VVYVDNFGTSNGSTNREIASMSMMPGPGPEVQDNIPLYTYKTIKIKIQLFAE
jgi:hypothetical protein